MLDGVQLLLHRRVARKRQQRSVAERALPKLLPPAHDADNMARGQRRGTSLDVHERGALLSSQARQVVQVEERRPQICDGTRADVASPNRFAGGQDCCAGAQACTPTRRSECKSHKWGEEPQQDGREESAINSYK